VRSKVPEIVQLPVGETTVPFMVDFEDQRWSTTVSLAEAEFPLIAVFSGKRYEFYSDGTLSEQELNEAELRAAL
jgi:hypothetical protein